MSITVNIIYRGKNGAARAYAEEMLSSGTVAAIRAEDGNEAYEYFLGLEDPEQLLLIDRWRDREALDVHHATPMMDTIATLRDKHDLHMEVRRFEEETPSPDGDFIRQ